MANVETMKTGSGKSYTLHVKNIPKDLEKDGVTSIFFEYGQVTGVILIKDANKCNQAYISYSKYNEAEEAIMQLHEKLPLMLNIEFKDKNLKNNNKEIQLSGTIQDFRYNEPIIDDTIKSVDLIKTNCTPSIQSITYPDEDDVLYPIPSHPLIFNPYEPSGPYDNTNLMYTRGTLYTSRDGRRHVSCGRGVTFYRLPNPHSNVAKYIKYIHEKREKGSYEYCSDNIEIKVDNCKVCLTPAPYYCQKCNIAFYCSRTCQKNDWAKHKFECQPIPLLMKKQQKTLRHPTEHFSEIRKSNQDDEVFKVSKEFQKEDVIQSSISHFQDTASILPIQSSAPNDIINEISNYSSPINSLSINQIADSVQNDNIAYKSLEIFPSVIDTLKVDDAGLILIHANLDHNQYNITLVPKKNFENFKNLLHNLKEYCLAELVKNPSFRPEEGDIICGESIETQEWFRGVVLSSKPPIKMAVIDESRVFVPINFTQISLKYKNICSLGLVCQFPDDSEMLVSKPVSGDFTVTKIFNDTVLIDIILHDNSKQISNALLKKWTPKPEQKSIEYVNLKSGDRVKIVHLINQNLIYVHNLVDEQQELTYRLEQDIAKCSLNKEILPETPVIGQMVMAHYKADNNYYRAIVIKIKNNTILVKYVDYGNEEIITMDKIFVLPDDLKERPSRVTKVKLSGVNPYLPLNQEVTNFFEELIAESTELICKFDNNPFQDGVELKTLQNENVNFKINKLIAPSWEQNDTESNIIFTLLDLPVLKLGNVGDEVQVVLIRYYDNYLFLGPDDEIAAKAIQEEMLDNIAAYVNKTKIHYIPRDNELCIAKYKNKFYRAVCLDSSASPTTSQVFLIDFGHVAIVEHTDIRIFTQDFANIGAFGTLCNITSISADKFTEKVLQRIQKLLSKSNKIMIKILNEKDDSLDIDIPSIRKKLVEENLL